MATFAKVGGGGTARGRLHWKATWILAGILPTLKSLRTTASGSSGRRREGLAPHRKSTGRNSQSWRYAERGIQTPKTTMARNPPRHFFALKSPSNGVFLQLQRRSERPARLFAQVRSTAGLGTRLPSLSRLIRPWGSMRHRISHGFLSLSVVIRVWPRPSLAAQACLTQALTAKRDITLVCVGAINLLLQVAR